MGKQYKSLKEKDIEFIKQQKLFFIASASSDEVNLSPKGYDSIRVLDANRLIFMSYPGSGNRTHRDATNNGKFTLLFNAYEGKANILRLFCKAELIEKNSAEFQDYLELFNEKTSLVRDFFKLTIYAVESSCGDAIPFMEYKGDRDSLKNWAVKMDKNEKLEAYNKAHFIPVDLQKI